MARGNNVKRMKVGFKFKELKTKRRWGTNTKGYAYHPTKGGRKA